MSNCLFRRVAPSLALLMSAALLSACVGVGEQSAARLLEPSAMQATPRVADSALAEGGLSRAQARQALLGKWYGIANTAAGVRKEWLVERAVDGTYRTDFRSTYPDGRVSSQAEVGFWGVSGEVYFRIFRGWVMVDGMKLGDPKNPAHYDAYRIEVLDEEHMRYRHLDKNRLYTMKKMPDSFRLPVVLESRNEAPLKFEF